MTTGPEQCLKNPKRAELKAQMAERGLGFSASQPISGVKKLVNSSDQSNTSPSQ